MAPTAGAQLQEQQAPSLHMNAQYFPHLGSTPPQPKPYPIPRHVGYDNFDTQHHHPSQSHTASLNTLAHSSAATGVDSQGRPDCLACTADLQACAYASAATRSSAMADEVGPELVPDLHWTPADRQRIVIERGKQARAQLAG